MTDTIVLGMMIACLDSGPHSDAGYCMKVMRREKPQTMEQVLDVQELARDELFDREGVVHCQMDWINSLQWDSHPQYGPPSPVDPCEEMGKRMLKETRARWKKAKKRKKL